MKTHKLIIIGHRGAKGLAPENSLESIRKALEHGVDEVEIDVRITKDNVAVLNHDPFTHDASGEKLHIKDHTFAELSRRNPNITSLHGALGQIDNKAAVVIEVKPGEDIRPVVEVISEYLRSGMYSATDLRVASFSQRTLRAVHAALPDIPLVVNEKWSGVRATMRARELGTRRITMRSWWLWRGFIASMSRRGWQLSSYTVNDRALAKRWANNGLYGVVTDFPDRFEN